jgi:hypothetical protein
MTARTELIARLKTAASQYYLLEYCDLMAAAAEMLMAVLPQCHPVQLVLSAAAGSYSLESASQPP